MTDERDTRAQKAGKTLRPGIVVTAVHSGMNGWSIESSAETVAEAFEILDYVKQAIGERAAREASEQETTTAPFIPPTHINGGN